MYSGTYSVVFGITNSLHITVNCLNVKIFENQQAFEEITGKSIS